MIILFFLVWLPPIHFGILSLGKKKKWGKKVKVASCNVPPLTQPHFKKRVQRVIATLSQSPPLFQYRFNARFRYIFSFMEINPYPHRWVRTLFLSLAVRKLRIIIKQSIDVCSSRMFG